MGARSKKTQIFFGQFSQKGFKTRFFGLFILKICLRQKNEQMASLKGFGRAQKINLDFLTSQFWQIF